MPPRPEPFSWYVLTALFVVLTVSCGVFWVLARRWTTQRRWAELLDWAADHGYRVVHPRWPVSAPEPANRWTDPPPRVRWLLTSGATDIVQMETDVTATAMPLHDDRTAGASAFTSTSGISDGPRHSSTRPESPPARWHLLIRRLETMWPPTGLRPRLNPASVLDLLPLSSFPALAPPERFVVFGIDAAAARRVARSHLLSLLPRDIGCLLHGSYLILDFSFRPFDTIELLRMISLADQLVENLPT